MPEDRFERLANLVTYLLDAGERRVQGATFADIVAAIPGYPEGGDARRRAFERDKKLLRDEDIPLVEENGRYLIPADAYYLPDLRLGDDEQLALQLAVAAVPLGDGGDAGSALQKLTIGSDLAEFDGRPVGATALADLDEHPLLPRLHAAIRNRSTVTFAHGGAGSQAGGAQRTVEPAMLFFREGHWYLFGFDRLREAERNFRVDRIEGDVEVGGPDEFERRDQRTPSAAMPKQPWMMGEAEGEPDLAVVHVDRVLAAKAIVEAGVSATVERHDDGSATLTLPVVQREAFRSWVLGFLDHAEVVGPPDLRDEIVDWLRSIVAPAR